MTIDKRFLVPSNPLLNQMAQAVSQTEISSSKLQSDIKLMLDIAYGEQTDRSKPVLVGLAAPQIGISKRIILVDIGADGHGGISNLRVFINPEITWHSHETNDWYEGCYSTDRVCGIVNRTTKIKIQAFDEEGTKVEGEYTDYTARIFQHEIDHLNGKEFVTHITNDNNLHWVEEYEFPKYRDNEAWRNWPNKCPLKRWRDLKEDLLKI